MEKDKSIDKFKMIVKSSIEQFIHVTEIGFTEDQLSLLTETIFNNVKTEVDKHDKH